MKKLECSACGGTLKESGQFLICEHCGTKYALGRDDEGNPFTYQPIEKKELSVGRMEAKANCISVNSITMKEIRLSDNIDSDVAKEGLHIDKAENIKIIPMLLANGEWDSAQEQINQMLMADSRCAEAQWFSMMCQKKANDGKVLVSKLSTLTENDRLKLDDILSNSSPSFAREIMDLMFKNAYINDSMCYGVFSIILPYAHNQSVYSFHERRIKGLSALEKTIAEVFPNAFELLLGTELLSNEVDRYIDCLNRFGDKCGSTKSQYYYSRILEVDPSNANIHRKLVHADVASNNPLEKTSADFESLLTHSTNPDGDSEWLLSVLTEENVTTMQKSQLFWQSMGYHSKAPNGLTKQINDYAKTLLRSSLWNEAKRYYQLLLSINSKDADAYWGLCHVRMQAKTDDALAGKKENLVDCQEFKKALALYKSAGNEQRAAEIMTYTTKQKNRKYYRKLIIVATLVSLVVLALFILLKSLKYNPSISLKFVNEFYGRDWEDEQVNFLIQAKSWVDVQRVSGMMIFYDSHDKEITRMTLNIPNLPCKKEKDYNLQINSNTARELDGTRFSELKITFAVTDVLFENGKRKDLGKGSAKVVKKHGEGDADCSSQTRKRYEEAMNSYDGVDITSRNALYDLTEAIALIDDNWNEVMNSWSLLEDMYKRADEYLKEEQYEKAYYLFSLLSVYLDYEDSTEKARLCEYYLQ